MKNTTDLRVIKTQKALVEALLEIIEVKPFEEISVQSICDLALVRRATFYTHFSDKYELFAFTIRYIYKEFPSYQFLTYPTRTKEMYIKLIEDTLDFCIEKSNLFKSIISSKMTSSMLDIISTEITRELLPILNVDFKKATQENFSPELAINFFVSGIFGAFKWWITENYPISKEEFLNQLRDLLPK